MKIGWIILVIGLAVTSSIYVYIKQRRYIYYKRLAHLLAIAYQESRIPFCILPPKMFNHRFDGFNFIFCKRYRQYVVQQFDLFSAKHEQK